MSDGSQSPDECNIVKKRRYLSSAEKKRLLEKFYQIPQPCGQRQAAAILNISQSTFSRLIGNRFAKKIDEKAERRKVLDVNREVIICTGKDKLKRSMDDTPRELKRLTTEEKLNFLKKYDELQPCTQRRAASLLKIPQSTLSDLLKARDELIECSDLKRSCRIVMNESNSRTLGRRQRFLDPKSKSSSPPPRKRQPPKRFEFDASAEVSTSDGEYGPSDDTENDSEDDSEEPGRHKLSPKQETIYREYLKLQKSNPCTQQKAAQTLGTSQSALSIILKVAGARKKTTHTQHSVKDRNSSQEEPSKSKQCKIGENGSEQKREDKDKRHRMRTLPEKIKIFRMFDAMQPCSQNKARAIFNISSSTLCGLMAGREAIEEEFRKQLIENIQVLKKYDALESHQLPRAHLICGLSKSKLDNVLANREFWEEEAANAANVDVPTEENVSPSTEMERVERELLVWYQANYTEQVTWMQLMDKARELARSFKSSFVPTDPWMCKWKRKVSHLLVKPKPDPPPVITRVDCANESSTVLPALKDYHPDDIFNLDETGLYYRAMPGYAPGKDDWVTVLFACNMSGTVKKKLTVVGKSEAPLFFGILSLPLNYCHSDDSRMTQEILSKFLEEWNLELRNSKKNIALILDNCSLHLNIDLKLDRISLFFVSNNSSSPSQPLNRGIISHTKTLFRKKLFLTVNKLVDNRRAVNDLVSKITLLDSLYMLAEAWDEVPVKIIINAFAELVFPNFSQPVRDEEPEEDIARLNQLDEVLSISYSDDDGRECMEDELSNEEYMVVHVEGVVDPSEDEIEETTPINGDANSANTLDGGNLNSSGLDCELRKFLDSPTAFGVPPKSSKGSTGSVKVENLFGENFCNDLGLSNSLEKEPPSSGEVHEALGVIKRFLRMNGGTLEDFTDFTQLEMKVLSKMKS